LKTEGKTVSSRNVSKTRTIRKESANAAENRAPKRRCYRLTPTGFVRTSLPTPEQEQKLLEQQAAMFTPDGQFRRIQELRETWQTERSKHS